MATVFSIQRLHQTINKSEENAITFKKNLPHENKEAYSVSLFVTHILFI